MTDKIYLTLAPMAGIADRAFRELCMEYGADGVTSEMISAKAVCFSDKKTFELARFSEAERPFSIQIFGSSPETMATAAKTLAARFNPDKIDINMGCPVPKVVHNGEGSALMRKGPLAYEIVARTVEAAGVPVSVKMRSAWDEADLADDTKNAVGLALLCEKAGASEITVHGKTRAQGYAPGVNLDIIRRVKQAVGIKVLGNGDVYSADDARKMLEKTGCDGIAVGRATYGRPWVFEEIKASFAGVPYTPPDATAVLTRHIEKICTYKPEGVAVRELRKHITHYIHDFPGAAALRDQVNRAETRLDLEAIIGEIERQSNPAK